MPVIPPGGGGGGIADVTFQEVDGNPSGTATVFVVPNGTLTVSGGTATYSHTVGSLVVQEVDGSPLGTATVLVFSNGTLSLSNGTATVTTG